MTVDFVAPDAGPGKLRYTCSYHVFRLPDGRAVVLDVVRSEDRDTLCLRAFVAAAGQAPQALLVEAPSAAWAPFTTTAPGDLDRTRNALGRGRGWVAGHVVGAGPSLRRVAFALDITVEDTGLATDRLGLAFLHLTVQDYTRVHYRGSLELDGQHHTIDSPGLVSVHLGERLPRYAYLASVPPLTGDPGPQVLLASVQGDNFKIGGALLGERAATYAYGRGGVPPVSLHIAPFELPIAIAPLHAIAVHDIRLLPHGLLGEPTVTGTARAVLVRPDPGLRPDQWLRQGAVELGEVIVEGRGADYAAVFQRDAVG